MLAQEVQDWARTKRLTSEMTYLKGKELQAIYQPCPEPQVRTTAIGGADKARSADASSN